MPEGLDKLAEIFGDDFRNSFVKKTSAKINTEQKFEMTAKTIIAHFPTHEDTQTCYQLISHEFRQIDLKDLYLQVTIGFQDSASEDFTGLDCSYGDECEDSSDPEVCPDCCPRFSPLTKTQVQNTTQPSQQEQEQFQRKLEWLKTKITECHGDFIILSGADTIANGLVSIEQEMENVRKGINDIKQYLEIGLVNNYNDYISRINDIINGVYCPNIENNQKAELEKAQTLLILAKKYTMPKEVEELETLIKIFPGKEAHCQESLFKVVAEQIALTEQSFAAFLQDIGPLPVTTYEQVSTIREFDQYYSEGQCWGIAHWEGRLRQLLTLVAQLHSSEQISVLKNALSTIHDIKQQVETLENLLEDIYYYVEDLFHTFHKISFEKLHRKFKISGADLKTMLEILIKTRDLPAHIGDTHLIRK